VVKQPGAGATGADLLQVGLERLDRAAHLLFSSGADVLDAHVILFSAGLKGRIWV